MLLISYVRSTLFLLELSLIRSWISAEYAELKELMREVELELIMRASGKGRRMPNNWSTNLPNVSFLCEVDVSDSIPADSGVSPPSTITDVVPQKAAAEVG